MARRFEEDIDYEVLISFAVVDGVAGPTRGPEQNAVALAFGSSACQSTQPTIAARLKGAVCCLFCLLRLRREFRQ